MTLTRGTRIGHFEVVELLGAGAMGAVYRARDSRLDRDVAIKLLPDAFSRDADRLRRFEHEARAVARLTHPHIVALYDVGTHEGSPFIVMELLEGETLRGRIAGRPLPPRKAIEYGIQIADALAAAHAHGLVHRDIKPDNLFVSRDGRLKILDFGLAKLLDTGAPIGTAADTLTLVGFVGTPAYAAPEQIRGHAADNRADLFGVGVVLYEMASGVSPFRRDTLPETMTAILNEEPPVPPPGTDWPVGFSRVVQHCLEKNPAQRFQHARDLGFALEAVDASASSPVAATGRRVDVRVLLLVAALAALAGVTAFMAGRNSATQAEAVGYTGVQRLTDFSGLEEFPALSPDGKWVAFTARVEGYRQIFVRLLAGGSPLPITSGPSDHDAPRWSPDSSSLIYFSPAVPGDHQGAVWEVAGLGGAPRRILETVGGCDLSRDRRLACFRLADGHVELVTASLDGSDVRPVERFDASIYYRYPRWSPDGTFIAYQNGDGYRWDVHAVRADGGAPRQLTAEAHQVHGLAWLPDGSGVIFSSSRGTTMAYLPDLSLWRVSLNGGPPVRHVTSDLSYVHPDAHASESIVASRLRIDSDLWRIPVAGTAAENVRGATRLTRQTGQVQTPSSGRSDSEVAFLSDSGGHANVWITKPDTGELRQVTHERDPDVSLGLPIWSPDGRWITFVSSRGRTGLEFGLWLVGPDGGNLRSIAARGLGAAWSPDGRWIYYADAGVLMKLSTDGGSAVRVREGPARNVIGLHGDTLYYTVDRVLTDGTPGFEIHAASPEDAPSRVLASISPRRVPQWQIINPALSPDGAQLAMPLTDGATTNIWALSTTSGEWRQVTDFGDRPIYIARRVSWAPDGRSIVAAIGEGDADIVLLTRDPAGKHNSEAR
jgi:Tol biopolymer transport system component